MDKKKKFILGALGLVIVSVVGLWEYMQVFMYYDIPQVILILPITGLVAGVFLGKYTWISLASVSACSIVFQAISEGKNVMGPVTLSKYMMVLNILPVVLIFLGIGIGAGLLLRVFTMKKGRMPIRVICLVLAVILSIGPTVTVFGNPVYTILAHVKLNNYAQKYNKEGYPISDVKTYFSYEDMDYQARVDMSDGVIHVIYYDREKNSVYDIEQ